MLTIERIENIDDFNNLRQTWNSILEDNGIYDPFLTWEWLNTWWRQYQNVYKLCIRIVIENQVIVGIAPLMLEIKRYWGFHLRVLTNIGSPPPDISGFIIPPDRKDILTLIADDIISARNEWDIFWIKEFPEFVLDNCFINRFMKFCYFNHVKTRHFLIPLSGDWDLYQNSLSKKLFNDLNRCYMRLSKLGKISYKRFIGKDVTDEHLHNIFDLNSRAHNPQGYNIESEKKFHINLCSSFQEQERIDISFLYINEKPIAYHYGFIYKGKSSLWRTGFDNEYRIYSPGKLLLIEYIKHCYKIKIETIDWLRGDHDYKTRWQAKIDIFHQLRWVQRKPIPFLFMVLWPAIRNRMRKRLEKNSRYKKLLKLYDSYMKKLTIKNMMKVSIKDKK